MSVDSNAILACAEAARLLALMSGALPGEADCLACSVAGSRRGPASCTGRPDSLGQGAASSDIA